MGARDVMEVFECLVLARPDLGFGEGGIGHKRSVLLALGLRFVISLMM